MGITTTFGCSFRKDLMRRMTSPISHPLTPALTLTMWWLSFAYPTNQLLKHNPDHNHNQSRADISLTDDDDDAIYRASPSALTRAPHLTPIDVENTTAKMEKDTLTLSTTRTKAL